MGFDAAASSSINMDNFVNGIGKEVGTSNAEDIKIGQAKINTDHERIQSRRKERIQNLEDQIKGPQGGSGKCLGALKVFTSIIDFLMKPISILTMNQLKTDLTKAITNFEKLKAKGQKVMMQIDGQNLSKIVESIKNQLKEHMDTQKNAEGRNAKDTEAIMNMIEQLNKGFKSTNNI